MRKQSWMWMVVGAMALMLASVPAMAQQGGGGNGGGGGGGGRGRGNFNPQQYRDQRMAQIKQQLGATDDEWKVLQPKIDKVETARNAARTTGMTGFGGRGGPGGGGATGGATGGGATNQPQTAIGKAIADLRSALNDTTIGADEIANRLKALRDARQKAHEEYEAAQKELKEVLTARQEAVLVVNGTLE